LSPTCPVSNCILRHGSALGREHLELRAWRHALYCSSKLRSGTKWRSWTEGSRHEPLATPTPGTNGNGMHCLQARSRAHLARSHVVCCDCGKQHLDEALTRSPWLGPRHTFHRYDV
jgi:hypothetical protein